MLKKYEIPFKFKPMIRLSEVEKILRQKKIIYPVPTRQTLLNYVIDGTLEGFMTKKRFYVVTVESFEKLIKDFTVQI
jgi:hypothetical protein